MPSILVLCCYLLAAHGQNYSVPGPYASSVTTSEAFDFSVNDTVNCVDDGTLGKENLCNVSLTVSYPTEFPTKHLLGLAVISPGFELPHTEYSLWAKRLASYGYMVVCWAPSGEGPMHHVTHDIRADMAFAVTEWTIGWSTKSKLEVDATRIFHVGHSLGGKTAVKTAEADKRVVGVLGIDPVDCGKVTGPISIPKYSPGYMPSATSIANSSAKFSWIGSEYGSSRELGMIPCAPAICNYQTFYGNTTDSTYLVEMLGEGHMDFLDTPKTAMCKSGKKAQQEIAHAAVLSMVIAWAEHTVRRVDVSVWMKGWLAALESNGSAKTWAK